MENEGEESLLLDGQTDALTLSLRYGLPQQWGVEVTVPWRHYSGGVTDNLISSWHRLFGLPDGNRHGYPTDALHYQLSQPEHDRPLLRSVSGLGDIHVAVSRPLLAIDGGQLGISAGMKTPCPLETSTKIYSQYKKLELYKSGRRKIHKVTIRLDIEPTEPHNHKPKL